MLATTQPPEMTVEAYLVWEPGQELRYEFVNGEVLAMTGGTLPHNDIAVNLLTALRPQVRAQGCRINIADAKVNVAPLIHRYPDLVISCDERDKTAITAIQCPKLVIEVLSWDIESLDRGDSLGNIDRCPVCKSTF